MLIINPTERISLEEISSELKTIINTMENQYSL